MSKKAAGRAARGSFARLARKYEVKKYEVLFSGSLKRPYREYFVLRYFVLARYLSPRPRMPRPAFSVEGGTIFFERRYTAAVPYSSLPCTMMP